MNGNLSAIERELAAQILKQNPKHQNTLGNQLEYLTVVSRKATGVGCYITFAVPAEKIADAKLNTLLGFNGEIRVEGVPSGLCCVMDVTDGRINYFELVTYGDELWGGDLEKAQIIPEKT